MNVWRHSICAACLAQRRPGGPLGQIDTQASRRCCFCGARTRAGVCVRKSPTGLVCNGRHAEPGECEHEPADPAAAATICWHCGAIVRCDPETGLWRLFERGAAPGRSREERRHAFG